jgi:hypothetical protein
VAQWDCCCCCCCCCCWWWWWWSVKADSRRPQNVTAWGEQSGADASCTWC